MIDKSDVIVEYCWGIFLKFYITSLKYEIVS